MATRPGRTPGRPKLVKVFYGLTTFSPLGEGDAHERAVKSIYKAAGWDLADERFSRSRGSSPPCR
jgi:conjugal transfer ATP-binding protein TraC